MTNVCRNHAGGVFVALASLFSLAGCERGPGYDYADLEGAITVAGQPLSEGSIRFLPRTTGQGPAVGAEIREGKYAVKHVPLGEIEVQFVAIRKTHRLPDDASGMQQWAVEDLIPEAARDGQAITVERGQTRCDFSL